MVLNFPPTQDDVLLFLKKQKAWVTPSTVGTMVGGYHVKEASHWGSAKLRELLKKGLVEYNPKRRLYRIKKLNKI